VALVSTMLRHLLLHGCGMAKSLFAFHNPHKAVASNNRAFRHHDDIA
jgi:hypothetical protein